ncbi:MAG: hypothetical protein ACRDOK_16155 [Streptosporangiaceae bacterium]
MVQPARARLAIRAVVGAVPAAQPHHPALAGQAEWHTRLLTTAAEQMAAETTRCDQTMLRTARAARTGAGQ